MSARSYLKRVERIGTTELTAEMPMSAFETFLLRNNLQHLADCASQVRVNWVASTHANEEEITAGNGTRTTTAWAFPLTITSATPPGLAYRIATRTTGSFDDGTVIVQMLPVDSGTPIFTHTYALSAVATGWVDLGGGATEETVEAPSWARLMITIPYFDVTTLALVTTPATFCMARLLITIVNDSAGSSSLQLVGVRLREFV